MHLIPTSLLTTRRQLRRARRQRGAGDAAGALATLEKLRQRLEQRRGRRPPPDIRQLEADVDALTGEAYLDMGRSREAVLHLLLAHPNGVVDPESQLFLVTNLLRQGEHRPKVLDVLEHFIRSPPSVAREARVAAAIADLRRFSAPRLKRGADLARGRAWNGRLARARPDLAWPRVHLGRIEAFEKRWSSAAREMAAACVLNPADSKSRRLLAYTLYRTGDFAEALDHLDRLPAKTPAWADLLLRGHLLRALGRAAEAGATFERAGKMRALRPSDALAHAECLIRARRSREASLVLEAIEGRRAAKWELAAAAAAQESGRPDLALVRLAQIRHAEALRPQVSERILCALAQLQADRESLSILDSLPESARDDRFWTLRGNALLAVDDEDEALASWERVSRPWPAFERALGALTVAWLAGRFHAGSDGEVLAAAGRSAVRAAVPAMVVPLMAAAMTRQIAGEDLDARTARRHLATLDKVTSELPDFATSPQAGLLRGLLLAAAGEPLEASIHFRKLAAADGLAREGWLQLARCALLTGECDAAAAALEKVSNSEPRTIRLQAALSALAGDWESASLALARDPRHGESEGTSEGFLPALQYLAGRDAELAKLAGDDGAARFYLAAARLRRGSDEATDCLSQKIEPVAEAPTRCRRLLAWAHFQTFRTRLAAGEENAAMTAIAAALDAWDGDEGPVDWLGGALDFVLPSLLAAGRRQIVRRLLDAQARREGPAQAPGCHRRGLFHLAEGGRAFREGEIAAAVEHWERAIGNLCAALANFTYLQGWVERRRSTYRTKIEAEDAVGVDPGVLQRLEGRLQSWSEAQEECGHASGAIRFADLAMSLRAERAAAQVLRDLGGFEDPSSGQRISAGPTYLAQAGLSKPFGAWVAALEVKSSRLPDLGGASNPLDMLMRLAEAMKQTKAEGSVEAATKEKVEHLFSSLRLAVVLAGEGQLEHALARLRTPEPRCFPISGDRHCGNRLRFACGEDAAHFERCNPAFAAPGGRERFARAAAELEIAILMRLGEEAVASTEDRLKEGASWWREALEVASEIGTRESFEERIRELLRGRSKVLESRGALEDGIRLLEAGRRVADDSFLRGKLAGYYAARGIEAVNERKAWAKGLADLRRAYKLNPNSTHTNLNLILALRGRAGDLVERGKITDARKLLHEALDRARGQLAADPHNTNLQQLSRELQLEVSMMGFSSATSLEGLLESIAGSSAGRLAESTRLHNRGVRKAEAGDLPGAVRDLEEALKLEPESAETRTMLAGVLNQHAVQLANAERFDEALKQLRRGLEIDPSNSLLQRNLQAATQGQMIHRLMSGEGLPRDLLKVLEMFKNE